MSSSSTSSSLNETMENNLRTVALLNTKGIHSLVMGRKHFVPRALQAFKKALEDLEKVRSSDSCDEHHLEAFNSSPLLPAQQGAFYVYNRAVFFKPLSDTSSIGFTFYAAILQFNMALAYHIKAQQSATGDSKNLHRALKYYKLCLKTLRQVGVCGSMADRPPFPGGGESMIYLRLAALNNLAHIHSLSNDYDKVNETLARVFKFTVAQRPILFLAQQNDNDDTSAMEDCSNGQFVVGRNATSSMNSRFVNEVLLNVMVSGPIAGAATA